MNTVPVTLPNIVHSLRHQGVMEGCTVLVHSSLSSFGYVEGGADAVITALQQTVGETGTLLMPTLTGNISLSADNPPTFDPQHTPCWTGKIPETFRTQADVVRSLHPTHSVAAWGAQADDYTRDHMESITPCDELSPFGKLGRDAHGYILLIGVDHESSTFFHAVEEAVGVGYHIQPRFAKAAIISDGTTTYRHYLLHQYGTPRNFNAMDAIFMERGIQKVFTVGKSTIRLVKAAEMFTLTCKCLHMNHSLLLA